MKARRKANKRGNNEGSIYKRGDGIWTCAVSLGYDAEGKVIRRVLYGRTREDVAAKLAELLDKSRKGLVAEPSKVTVAEYAQVYLPQANEGKAANTVRNYTRELEQALVYIGKMRLQAVKPQHIVAMVQRMKEEGWRPQSPKGVAVSSNQPYSARTIKKVLERLRAMFSLAVRHQLIYTNPCDAVQAPKMLTEPKGRTLEPDEIKTLLEALQDHPMGLLFKLLLDTGLRKGEALALTWGDVDLECSPPKLLVRKAWSSNRLTTPKTRRSKRKVPIPPSSAQLLRVLKASTQEKFGSGIDSLYLFGNPATGQPFEVNSPNHALRRLCESHNLKHIRVHDLRHTYGSLALSKGVPLEVVSERMGHANPTITLNVYRHLLEEERDASVLDFTGMFGTKPLEATENALAN